MDPYKLTPFYSKRKLPDITSTNKNRNKNSIQAENNSIEIDPINRIDPHQNINVNLSERTRKKLSRIMEDLNSQAQNGIDGISDAGAITQVHQDGTITQASRQTLIEREAWRLMLQKEIDQQVKERLASDEVNRRNQFIKQQYGHVYRNEVADLNSNLNNTDLAQQQNAKYFRYLNSLSPTNMGTTNSNIHNNNNSRLHPSANPNTNNAIIPENTNTLSTEYSISNSNNIHVKTNNQKRTHHNNSSEIINFNAKVGLNRSESYNDGISQTFIGSKQEKVRQRLSKVNNNNISGLGTNEKLGTYELQSSTSAPNIKFLGFGQVYAYIPYSQVAVVV